MRCSSQLHTFASGKEVEPSRELGGRLSRIGAAVELVHAAEVEGAGRQAIDAAAWLVVARAVAHLAHLQGLAQRGDVGGRAAIEPLLHREGVSDALYRECGGVVSVGAVS